MVECSPGGIRPRKDRAGSWTGGLASQGQRFDATDPVVGREFAVGERGEDFEDGIRESADVQDVRAFRSLGGGVGLDVETDQPGVRVPTAKGLPFRHRGGAASPTGGVEPAHVVRDEDNEVGGELPTVEVAQRGAAVGSSVRQSGQGPGIGQDRVTGVETNGEDVVRERQDERASVFPG